MVGCSDRYEEKGVFRLLMERLRQNYGGLRGFCPGYSARHALSGLVAKPSPPCLGTMATR